MARSDVSQDRMGDGSLGRDLVSVDTETDEKFLGSEELHREQLLPGIYDEITVDHISTKLAWTELHVLSSVSPGWKQAFDSHLIFAARVRSQSAETVFVHNHLSFRPEKESVAVYCPKEDHCYELPSIPFVDRGIPEECGCVSLNGKLYILGGGQDGYYDGLKGVYVYDLLGRGPWQQCASMQSGRKRFGCGVLDGKIYVFGGFSGEDFVPGSEVYDPDTNAWIPISPLPSLRLDSHVATSGEELFVHGGDGKANTPLPLEVYQPGRDQWQVREPFSEMPPANVFMAGGKFYLISWKSVYVHDSDANTWKEQHSNSFRAAIGPTDSFLAEPWAIVVVNVDELLLGVSRSSYCNVFHTDLCLLRSKGFGTAKKELVWEIVENCTSFSGGHFFPVLL